MGELGLNKGQGIIKDSSAIFILSLSGGFCSVNEAELLALRMGVRQAAKVGLSNIMQCKILLVVLLGRQALLGPLGVLQMSHWSWV